MIITFACPSAPHPIGGVTALYDFANALSRRGHEVHLVHAPFFENRIESMDDLAWADFEPGVRHHVLGLDRLYGPHDEFPRGDIVIGTGAPREYGLPVHLIQGFEMLYPWIEEAAFRSPSLKVCVASWLVDVGAWFGLPRDRIRVAPMGIDHDLFRPRRPIEDRPLRVAVLHSAHPAKGWQHALAALDLVQRRIPDLEVVAFGTAAPPDPLPSWLTFRLDPATEVLTEEIYGGSRVFLQASDYEGFGFTAIEAMACGAALVTTDNGGSRDYARPGETASVVAPADVDAMAEAVTGLLCDEEARVRTARAGERLVRRFDWDLGAEVLEGHLQEYLEAPEHLAVQADLDLRGLAQGGLAARILGPARTGLVPTQRAQQSR